MNLKQVTYDMDRENFSPMTTDGMKVVYGDRTDSFRATLIPDIVYVERERPLHLQLMKEPLASGSRTSLLGGLSRARPLCTALPGLGRRGS